MLKIPKKVTERFSSRIKAFQAIATSHKAKDVSEADTVTLVKDILADVFGYDKYAELTSEQQIRGTFCDLAVKIDGKIKCLIEVKSAGSDLCDAHLRQAINYAANQGIEWVVLTTGIDWRLHRVKFAQPIDCEEVSSFNFLNVNLRNEEDIRKLFLLCREGLTTDAMSLYHQHTQLLNKFTVSQVIQTDAVISVIRKEFKKLFPELMVDQIQISDILVNEVLKRDVVESEKAKEVQQKLKKVTVKLAKQAEKKLNQPKPNPEIPIAVVSPAPLVDHHCE